ncbi:transcriptional regulator [Actinorhabdospora filicis]|uniref:Transcriptional regulator n=1 Tax=Actinorhabdospora filicis TaxID=1785913 RepID=A0A9W6W0X2_9ACTN|nr:helix-turn-helix transcriptional regulator [Actinorhabdospora filicis]GLZ75247.1 transcriptional regulator [Actinorhabdospora filicis]
MDRPALAEYLRARRARVKPATVGLPDAGRRRTPGLRRQEVAQLAGMSIEYYIRLEQARGPRPSRQILSALSRALMLTMDERAHLFHLAGETVGPQSSPDSDVPVGVRHLLRSLVDIPAYVVNARYDVVAWNALAELFLGAVATYPLERRNVVRWVFAGVRPDFDANPAHLDFARSTVADLRAAHGRYPDDPGLRDLVQELLRTSPEFAGMWAEHEVEVRRHLVKKVTHPELGVLEMECQTLHVPDRDQRVIMYIAEPGSPTHETFRRLAREMAIDGA